MKVKDLMRRKPKIAHFTTPLEVVWRLISQKQMHMVPVVDENNLIKGIITAEDLLIHLVPDYQEFFSDFFPTSPTIDDIEAKIEAQIELTASDVMNTTVYTAYQNHDVFKALSRMLIYDKRVLPVTDENEKLVGFIVEKDIFKYLFEKQKHILKKIRKKQSKKVKVEVKGKKSKKDISKISLLAKALRSKPSKYLKFLGNRKSEK